MKGDENERSKRNGKNILLQWKKKDKMNYTFHEKVQFRLKIICNSW